MTVCSFVAESQLYSSSIGDLLSAFCISGPSTSFTSWYSLLNEPLFCNRFKTSPYAFNSRVRFSLGRITRPPVTKASVQNSVRQALVFRGKSTCKVYYGVIPLAQRTVQIISVSVRYLDTARYCQLCPSKDRSTFSSWSYAW